MNDQKISLWFNHINFLDRLRIVSTFNNDSLSQHHRSAVFGKQRNKRTCVKCLEYDFSFVFLASNKNNFLFDFETAFLNYYYLKEADSFTLFHIQICTAFMIYVQLEYLHSIVVRCKIWLVEMILDKNRLGDTQSCFPVLFKKSKN